MGWHSQCRVRLLLYVLCSQMETSSENWTNSTKTVNRKCPSIFEILSPKCFGLHLRTAVQNVYEIPVQCLKPSCRLRCNFFVFLKHSYQWSGFLCGSEHSHQSFYAQLVLSKRQYYNEGIEGILCTGNFLFICCSCIRKVYWNQRKQEVLLFSQWLGRRMTGVLLVQTDLDGAAQSVPRISQKDAKHLALERDQGCGSQVEGCKFNYCSEATNSIRWLFWLSLGQPAE